jgi:ABC-type polysaccharide/polyol phosphate transport system ATPase subunit
MFVRLAFAISTAIEPDIVVMDEMIGAGDQSFIEKAQKRVAQLLDRARILVLASHSELITRSFCNNVLWLEKGLMKMFGPVDEVMAAYGQPSAPVVPAQRASIPASSQKISNPEVVPFDSGYHQGVE